MRESQSRETQSARTWSEFVPFSGRSDKPQVLLSLTWDKLICHK